MRSQNTDSFLNLVDYGLSYYLVDIVIGLLFIVFLDLCFQVLVHQLSLLLSQRHQTILLLDL